MRVLLVDHDSEALETVTRAIRGVLELDCVTSKGDALLLLRQNTYDVLIACERCIDGSGLDLLGRTTRTAVPLKRIFAAAPERLQLLGPRLAPFKVQRTINYPIDLEELWLAIAQVTSGPDDETDGTIERVVLDERGIPSTGSVPRSPIPPRPPAPLSAVPPPPIGASAGRGHAAARLTQPAPEPALAATAATACTAAAGRTCAGAAAHHFRHRPDAQPVPPAALLQPPPQPAPPMMLRTERRFRRGRPNRSCGRFCRGRRTGALRRSTESDRRSVTPQTPAHVIAACGIAVVVAGTLVLLSKTSMTRRRAPGKRRSRIRSRLMGEQQKASDNLARHRVRHRNRDHEQRSRYRAREFAVLIEKSPDHPRLEFLRSRSSAPPNSPSSRRKARQGRGSGSREVRLASRRRANTRSGQAARRTQQPSAAPTARSSRTTKHSAAARPRASAPPPTRTYGAPLRRVAPPVAAAGCADQFLAGHHRPPR